MTTYSIKIIDGESYSLIESIFGIGCDRCALCYNNACKCKDFLCFNTDKVSYWIKTADLRKQKLEKLNENNSEYSK